MPEGDRAKRHVCWRLTENYRGPIFPFRSARQTMGFERQVSLALQIHLQKACASLGASLPSLLGPP